MTARADIGARHIMSVRLDADETDYVVRANTAPLPGLGLRRRCGKRARKS